MREESVAFNRDTQIEQFLSKRTETLNTFKELTCPKCGIELEDGDLVTRAACNDTYHRACLEEMLKSGEDYCIKGELIMGDPENPVTGVFGDQGIN